MHVSDGAHRGVTMAGPPGIAPHDCLSCLPTSHLISCPPLVLYISFYLLQLAACVSLYSAPQKLASHCLLYSALLGCLLIVCYAPMDGACFGHVVPYYPPSLPLSPPTPIFFPLHRSVVAHTLTHSIAHATQDGAPHTAFACGGGK